MAARRTTGPAHAANQVTWRDFARELRAERRAPNTIRTYHDAFASLAATGGGARDVLSLAKPDIQEWLIGLAASCAPITVRTYYRGAARFYRWAAEEQLVTSSPMTGMSPPQVTEIPLPIPPLADVRAVLAAADKDRSFEGVRDAAVIRTWCEAGSPRRAEMAALTLADVDLDAEVIRIPWGKGGKFRVFPLSSRTARAWARYLRARPGHRHAASPRALLGRKGPVTGDGLYSMLARRCAAAGVPEIHPHQLRHFATDRYLSAGGRERDMMRLNGWSSPAMLSRYGAAAADRRATDAARALAVGDAL
jgi:integrase/recombinase XerD